MKKGIRRKHGSDFKAKVVIEALKERDTIEDLSKKFELHPTQINNWKKEFLSNAALAFTTESDISAEKKGQEAVMEKLYSQIGQLKMENDFLKKKLY